MTDDTLMVVPDLSDALRSLCDADGRIAAWFGWCPVSLRTFKDVVDRRPTRFKDAARDATQERDNRIVELSPGRSLKDIASALQAEGFGRSGSYAAVASAASRLRRAGKIRREL